MHEHCSQHVANKGDVARLLSQAYPRLHNVRGIDVLELSAAVSVPLCADAGDGTTSMAYAVLRYMEDVEMLFDIVLAQTKRIHGALPAPFILHIIEDVYFEQYQKRLAALDP